MHKQKILLVHLHPDFQQPLEELLDNWNKVQKSWNFVGLRPKLEAERLLLTSGKISDESASRLASDIRTSAGYTSETSIIIFTEKRLYDDEYFQLFVGGRKMNEIPPSIGILSLDFLRKTYLKHTNQPILFRAIISNILFSIGIDCGLDDHGDEIKGCIMDFCEDMSSIEIGLINGPKFCKSCLELLEKHNYCDLILLSEFFQKKNDINNIDCNISESIVLRGKRYQEITGGFDFDVAISYSKDDKKYAKRLAESLRSAGVKVFFDLFDQPNLWGKNLHIYLTELYQLRARYCVIFVSKNYQSSNWTRIELEAALSRELKEGINSILPILLDDTIIPGILPTTGTIKWEEYTCDEIVLMLKKKLGIQNTISTDMMNK